MPVGSGRKQAPEWSEVTRDDESGKVSCKYCQTSISKKIERIRLHLKKCPRRTFSTPLDIFESPFGRSSSFPSEHQTTPKSKQVKLEHFTTKTIEQQTDQLDVLVAKFFYANNIPWNVADSKEYKAMIEALRPGYVGPDSLKLSNTLIEKVVEEIDTNLKIKLQEHNSSVTLLQGGWSNIKNGPFMATGIHTGQHAFLLNAVDCESNKKPAEYYQESLVSAIETCLDKYGKSVFAVCTVNENKMKKMRHLLTENMPGLLTYGCSAHYINLLGDEISPKNVLKDIIEVHKYFRNHHQPQGWLIEKDGLMPQLPNCTRWSSQFDCLSTFIDNYTKYIEIATEHFEEVSKDVTKLLDNVTIYKETVQHLKQLSEVRRGLDLIQADNTNIAQAVEIWMDILENPDLECYKEVIKRKMEQALEPFHYLANLLDPRFRGKRLSASQENCAEKWLTENHPEWLARYMSFRISDPDFFPTCMFSESFINEFTPTKWWKIMELKSAVTGSLPTEFILFTQSLLSCPASTVSIEQILSTCSLVWSKLRNQFAADQAEKLVKIHHYLNL